MEYFASIEVLTSCRMSWSKNDILVETLGSAGAFPAGAV